MRIEDGYAAVHAIRDRRQLRACPLDADAWRHACDHRADPRDCRFAIAAGVPRKGHDDVGM